MICQNIGNTSTQQNINIPSETQKIDNIQSLTINGPSSSAFASTIAQIQHPIPSLASPPCISSQIQQPIPAIDPPVTASQIHTKSQLNIEPDNGNEAQAVDDADFVFTPEATKLLLRLRLDDEEKFNRPKTQKYK